MDDFSDVLLIVALLICATIMFVGIGMTSGQSIACEKIANELAVDYFLRNRECFLEVNGTFVRLIDLIKLPS